MNVFVVEWDGRRWKVDPRQANQIWAADPSWDGRFETLYSFPGGVWVKHVYFDGHWVNDRGEKLPCPEEATQLTDPFEVLAWYQRHGILPPDEVPKAAAELPDLTEYMRSTTRRRGRPGRPPKNDAICEYALSMQAADPDLDWKSLAKRCREHFTDRENLTGDSLRKMVDAYFRRKQRKSNNNGSAG